MVVVPAASSQSQAVGSLQDLLVRFSEARIQGKAGQDLQAGGVRPGLVVMSEAYAESSVVRGEYVHFDS